MPFCEMTLEGCPVTSSPSKKMRPEVGGSTPVRQLKNVLLPAPFGPMMARTSSRCTSKLIWLSAVSPPNRRLSSSVLSMGPGRAPRLSAGERWPMTAGSLNLGRGEVARRRNESLVLRHRLQELVVAVLDLEDELGQEGLVVVLAQGLVALREVLALLDLETLERLDQLHGVLAVVELRLLHGDLHRVERLVVRLHVFVGTRARWIDLDQALLGLFVELFVGRRVERPLEDRNVTVDGGEALDLVALRRQVGRLGDRAVAGHLVLLAEAEIVGLVDQCHAVLAEADAAQAVEVAGDFRQERRHVGRAERNAGGADHFAAVLLDRGGVGVAGRLTPRIVGVHDVPLLAHLG